MIRKIVKVRVVCSICLCLCFWHWYEYIWEESSPPMDWPTWSNIDFVIPWAGRPKTHINGTDIARERYNKELPYLFRSIAKHAPWVRKIYLLINTDSLPPDAGDIPPSLKNRTFVLDRCSYMPKGTCPTRNSHAVKAFAHRIPGLAERYVIGDDDIFFGRPVAPSHFYENGDGKPFVWRKKPTWGPFHGIWNYFSRDGFHRIYVDPTVVNFSTPLSAAPSPHFWYPQLKNVSASLEERYPEFYAFLGSHAEGRYSSLAKAVSDKANSQEECAVGFINWELLRSGKGVFKNIDNKRYEWWDEVEVTEATLKRAVKDRAIFMNFNDHFSKDETVYRKEIKLFEETMEKMFPLEDSS